MIRTHFKQIAAGFLLVALLTGCASNNGTATVASSGTAGSSSSAEQAVTIGLNNDLGGLDPTLVATLTDRGIFSNVFDTLITYDADTGKYSPALAEKWNYVNDTTIEFKLRSNVKFSDGSILKASDVVTSLKRLYDPSAKSRLSDQANWIKDVKAVDDSTIQVITKRPTANALSYIATWMIASADSLKKSDSKEIAGPVGTGPFSYSKWNKQQDLTLIKNPNYWNGTVKLSKVVFRIIPKVTTRVDELNAGSIDVADQITPDMLTSLQSNKNVTVMQSLSSTLFIGCNVFSGALKDVRVRKAITEAIDGQSIAKNLYNGTATVLNQPVTQQSKGYSKTVKNYEYNPEDAKKLLAEAGYPNGLTLNYDGPQGKYLLDTDLSNEVAQELSKNLNIKLNVKLTEYGTYWDNFLAKKCSGLYLAAITNPIQDAEFVLNLHMYSKGRGIYYNSKETDSLLESAKSTLDETKRQGIYDQLMQKIHDDNPWVLTLSTNNSYGVSNRLKGFKPEAYSKLYFGNAYLG